MTDPQEPATPTPPEAPAAVAELPAELRVAVSRHPDRSLVVVRDVVGALETAWPALYARLRREWEAEQGYRRGRTYTRPTFAVEDEGAEREPAPADLQPIGGGHLGEMAVCPDCGPGVGFDEDGCCTSCGAQTTNEPCRWVPVAPDTAPGAPALPPAPDLEAALRKDLMRALPCQSAASGALLSPCLGSRDGDHNADCPARLIPAALAAARSDVIAGAIKTHGSERIAAAERERDAARAELAAAEARWRVLEAAAHEALLSTAPACARGHAPPCDCGGDRLRAAMHSCAAPAGAGGLLGLIEELEYRGTVAVGESDADRETFEQRMDIARRLRAVCGIPPREG